MHPTTEEIILNSKEISTEQWTEYVINHPRGSIRHLPEWKEILEESFGYEPYYLFAVRDNEIEGILPLFKIKSALTKNRLSSVPFSSTCGPIADSGEISGELITKAKRLLKELDCEYLELRTNEKDFQPDSGLVVNGYYVTYILELSPNIEEVWKKLDKGSVRWAIKKSQKSGVSVNATKDIEDLKEFYELNCMTKKEIGVPCHPWGLFKNLFTFLGDYVSLYVATYSNEIIAGGIMEYFKDTVGYGYGAANPRYLKLHPYNAFIWKSIEDACVEGYKYYDFGRTSYDNVGLINFKKRWGTIEKKLYYSYYPKNPESLTENRDNLKYKFGTKVIRRMPMPIYKKFSDVVFKHFG